MASHKPYQTISMHVGIFWQLHRILRAGAKPLTVMHVFTVNLLILPHM